MLAKKILDLAKKFTTPLFIIDLDRIRDNYLTFKAAFPEALVFYSFKTNSHPEIVRALEMLGAGIVVSSIHELKTVLNLGFRRGRILYHSVATKLNEFQVILDQDVYGIVANSIGDLKRVARLCVHRDKDIRLGIRIASLDNTIENSLAMQEKTKFGITKSDFNEVKKVLSESQKLNLSMLAYSVGTNVSDPACYLEALSRLNSFSQGQVETLNLGGGFASESVLKEKGFSIFSFGERINAVKGSHTLVFEPGRYIVEDACYCLSEVVSIHNNHVILDICGNFLIPLAHTNYVLDTPAGTCTYTIAGRLCFGTDLIQTDVSCTLKKEGDILKIKNCGAYTFSMRNPMSYPDPKIIIKDDNQYRTSSL